MDENISAPPSIKLNINEESNLDYYPPPDEIESKSKTKDEQYSISNNNIDYNDKENYNYDNNVEYEEKGIEEERTAYSRVMALAGNFICIYSIDPETLHYVKYQGNSDFDTLNLSEQGEDFFSDCYRESADVIYPEDLDFFRASLNRDKVFREIEKSGEFTMIYRLMLNGRPEYMNLKAVINDEDGKKTLVLGVSRYS